MPTLSADLVGQLYALGAALTWSISLVLFRLSGEHISPLALNLYKNVFAMVCLVLTLLLTGDDFRALEAFTWQDHAILCISGFLGIALADTAFLYALNVVGVGLVTIIECLYSPLVVVFAFLMLSESMTGLQVVGAALVLSGLFVSTQHDPPPNRTHAELVLGFVFGAASVALMAFGIVLARPVLVVLQYPLIWAALLRLVAGTAALALLAGVSPKRGRYWSVFRPRRVWITAAPAAFFGTYLAMIFWIAGFKYTQAAIAAILNQTSVVFALILATLFLREPFTRRKAAAVVLAAVGVYLVVAAAAPR